MFSNSRNGAESKKKRSNDSAHHYATVINKSCSLNDIHTGLGDETISCCMLDITLKEVDRGLKNTQRKINNLFSDQIILI